MASMARDRDGDGGRVGDFLSLFILLLGMGDGLVISLLLSRFR